MSSTLRNEVLSDIRAGVRITDQQIVDKIRKAVLTQRLPPGTRLPEVTLGEVFGVSRSVVRKALTRLDAEHVVCQQPNQGARVRAPSTEETRETFAARRLVEGEVAALLAGRLEALQLEALEEAVQQEVAAHARHDEPARIEYSLAIHHLLAELSPNKVLGGMLTDLILRTSIVIALYKRDGLASCYLEGHHLSLLRHLRAGEPVAARRCIEEHLLALENLMVLTTRDASIDLMAILGQQQPG